MSLHALISALLFGAPPESTQGLGAQRAAARLKAKRDANKAIPSGEVYTRQRARADMRSFKKQLRSARKEQAMQDKTPGGAAATN